MQLLQFPNTTQNLLLNYSQTYKKKKNKSKVCEKNTKTNAKVKINKPQERKTKPKMN